MTNNLKSNLYGLSAVLLWSTVATAFKITLNEITPAQLVFYSSLFSTLALAAVFVIKKEKFVSLVNNKKSIIHFALLGLLNPFVYYMVLFGAYDLLPAQEAQPINYTWPIAIGLFSVIFLGTKINFKIVVGNLLAFFGVILIATHGNLSSLQFHNVTGVILAAASAFIWASFWVLNLIYKEPPITKLLGSSIAGNIYSLLFLVVTGSFVVPGREGISGSAYIGFFEMGITFILWMEALKLSENKAKTSTLAFLSPFLSMIFIALILKETILISSLVGLVLIVGGIILQNIKSKAS